MIYLRNEHRSFCLIIIIIIIIIVVLIGGRGTDVEAETPILWPLDVET